MFGGVPMRVSMPPSSDEKDRGMSRRAGLIPTRRAMATTTGMRMATVPVELMKLELTALAAMMTAMRRRSVEPPSRVSCSPSQAVTPEPCRPAPTTNSPAISRTTELENPARASFGVSTPVSINDAKAIRLTRSSGRRSLTKSTTVAVRMTRTMTAGEIMSGTSSCPHADGRCARTAANSSLHSEAMGMTQPSVFRIVTPSQGGASCMPPSSRGPTENATSH
jgi:hypothetical protein